MRVISSSDITQAAALAIRCGVPVLILRTDLISATDLQLIQSLLVNVSARVEDALSILGQM